MPRWFVVMILTWLPEFSHLVLADCETKSSSNHVWLSNFASFFKSSTASAGRFFLGTSNAMITDSLSAVACVFTLNISHHLLCTD